MEKGAALSINESARFLGIGRSTLYGLIRNGDLPIRKLGKRSLILKVDLEAFLQALPVAGASWVLPEAASVDN